MDLDFLFGGNSNSSGDPDTIDTDAEVQDVEEADDHEIEEPQEENGIGWKVLALFICGGLVITALAVAFMVWVIEGLVL